MKDDIDKLDEQIQNIIDTDKEMNSDGKEIIIDKEVNEDDFREVDSVSTDTKKIEHVDDLKDEVPEEEESTKEMDTVEDTSDKSETALNDSSANSLESSKEEKPAENKSRKKMILYIALGTMIVLLLILLIVLLVSKNDKKEDVAKSLSKKEQSDIIQKYGDALSGIISVYLDKKEVLLSYDEAIQLINFDYDVDCSEHEIYEDGTLYLNQCMIDNNKTTSSYGKKKVPKEITIPEGAIKVYVTDRGASFEEPKDGTKYEVFGLVINEPYTDLNFFDAKNSDYVYYIVGSDTDDPYAKVVNYKTNDSLAEKLYVNKVYPIKVGEDVDSDYVVIAKKNSWNDVYLYGVFDINKWIQVVSPSFDDMGSPLQLGVFGPRAYVTALEKNKLSVVINGNGYVSTKHSIIDYRNGNYIVPPNVCNMLIQEGKYLWCKNEKDAVIYDLSGKKVFTDKYDKVYGLVSNFLLVQDGKNLKMVSTDGKVLYNYGEYSLKSANYALKYGDGAIFQFPNNTKGDDYDYDSSESCIEVIYSGNNKGELKPTYCGGIAKPILYLYPEKETKVSVSFEHPEYLETTYPKFKDSWNVVAYPNGDLYDENHKYYYGLYWDEAKAHVVDFHEGFYVDKKHAIDFLEEKLSTIGLNDRERNEFIMYWLPILEKNEKNLVYFELTDEREAVNRLKISPKPDSLLRIVIHVKKVHKKVSIREQKLPSFNRKGFTAVEWGGTTY